MQTKRSASRRVASAAEIAEAAGEMGVAAARWCDAAELARVAGLGAEHANAAARASVAMLDAGDEGHAAVWATTALEAARAAGLTATFQLAEAAQAAAAIAVHPDGHFFRSLVTAAEALAGSGRLGDAATGLALLARGHLAFGDVGATIRTLGRAEPMARAAVCRWRTAFATKRSDWRSAELARLDWGGDGP